MGKPAVFERRVEFRDTDAAGIMHFSVFFNCMEQAEHELFRSVGLSVMLQHEGQTISWPRVSANCDYRGSFRFEDIMRIETSISKIGNSSLTFAFRFFRNADSTADDSAESATELASGTITTVCCTIDDHPPTSIPIPESIREQLAPFVIN